MRKANLCLCNDDELVIQAMPIPFEQPSHSLHLDCRAFVGQSEKDNPAMGMVLTVDLLAEVLVVCNQYPILGKCLLENRVIARATCFIEHGEHLVALISEPSRNRRPSAFIDEESHLRCSYREPHE